ncbi:MAG: hypothetical protein IJH83_03980 [Coriobacteriales bacterium]|nr:hypothetical protein [Coriobacteriales bacterium]
MPLIAAKCPACGANIQVPDEGEKCFCAFCGTQILREAAVNFAKVKVEGVVETRSADFDIQAGRLVGYHGSSADVVIPDNVTHIGKNAFGNLPVRSISIPVDKDWWWFTEDLRAMYDLEEIKCHHEMFKGCWAHFENGIYWNPKEMIFPRAYKKQEVTIPSDPAKIELKGIRFLRKLTLAPSDSATEIEIADCPWLQEVILPAKGIKSLAIKKCAALQSIRIPEGCLVRLDVSECPELRELSQNDSSFDKLSVSACGGLQEIICPSCLKELSVRQLDSLGNIVVRGPLDAVTIYGTPALHGINGSTCFVFPKGTKTISIEPGKQNTEEHQVILFPGVTRARYFVANLTGVELKDGITELGDERVSFGSKYSGYGLKGGRLVLPASLKKIGLNNFNEIDYEKCAVVFPSLETADIASGTLRTYRSRMWKAQGRCAACGGRIKGLREKKCSVCGRRP